MHAIISEFTVLAMLLQKRILGIDYMKGMIKSKVGCT